jgi:glycine/D-amino acid oxidase-like deaminating enzyme
MHPPLDPFTPDEALPEAVDVVVIGGGIIGVSTALELAERGVSVALVEKGGIGAEQSSRNWGWCRQTGRDPREIPLIRESIRLWRGMNQRIGAETGFRTCGILYLAETEQELAQKADWFDRYGRPWQIESRLVTGEEAARLMPGSAIRWHGGLHTPSDGRAEPQKASPAIAAAARRLGAKVFTGCAARGIETKAGRVSAVVTERGTIRCSSVVLAGGAWSRLFCGNLGIHLPQLAVVNNVLRTNPIDARIETTGAGKRFAIRKRLDGGYTVAHRHLSVADIVPDSFRLLSAFWPVFRQDIGGIRLRLGRAFVEAARLPRRWRLDETTPFERVRVLDPEPVQPILDEAMASLKRTFPAFEGATVAQSWAGAIDATPDAVPVISGVEALPGFHLATGFSGHGFGIGPGAGKLMADLVTGKPPVVDPSPFRYTRFIDGTKPEPIAGL